MTNIPKKVFIVLLSTFQLFSQQVSNIFGSKQTLIQPDVADIMLNNEHNREKLIEHLNSGNKENRHVKIKGGELEFVS